MFEKQFEDIKFTWQHNISNSKNNDILYVQKTILSKKFEKATTYLKFKRQKHQVIKTPKYFKFERSDVKNCNSKGIKENKCKKESSTKTWSLSYKKDEKFERY